MSLILEALRKSEAERRRGQAPDVAMELPPVAVRRSAAWPRWWPWLLLAAGVLLALAWWRQPGAPPASADPFATLPAPAGASAISEPGEPAAPAVVIAPPTRTPALGDPPARAPAVQAPPPQASAPPRVAPDLPVRMPPPPSLPAPPLPAPVADIAATTLPPVRLSMHMWNEAPAQRFVILDGQRMVEGDRRGDLLVVEIERDGVLVERNGQRTRIPLR